MRLCTDARRTSCRHGRLDGGQAAENTPPSAPVGGSEGGGGYFRMYPCVLRGGGATWIVAGQIPGGAFLACLCSRISNQRPAPPPSPPPVCATPLIVSDRRNWFQLTPIQRPFEWQTKDTATWRLMLVRSILEVVPSPPALSPSAPPTGSWVRSSSLITLCTTAGLNRNLWWNVEKNCPFTLHLLFCQSSFQHPGSGYKSGRQNRFCFRLKLNFWE